jgi:arabinose-5-phosphate isomerase
MSRKGMGMTVVADGERRVSGIFTDGDLRRCVSALRDFASTRVADVMTRNPRTVGPDALAIDCVDAMETAPKVSQLVVVDEQGRLVGALHLHDLFKAKIV